MTTSSEVSGGVVLNRLAPGSHIEVATKSRCYHIECLGGSAIRISGHPQYCPQPESGQLEGSIGRDGVELGRIGCGKRMLFLLDNSRPVTTSEVVSVHVAQP